MDTIDNDKSVVITSQPSGADGAPPFQGPMLLGPTKSMTVCPFCNAYIQTTVRHFATSKTHIAAALCLTCGCCCIPYCSDSAKDTVHYCPKCKHYLGKYEK